MSLAHTLARHRAIYAATFQAEREVVIPLPLSRQSAVTLAEVPPVLPPPRVAGRTGDQVLPSSSLPSSEPSPPVYSLRTPIQRQAVERSVPVAARDTDGVQAADRVTTITQVRFPEQAQSPAEPSAPQATLDALLRELDTASRMGPQLAGEVDAL